MVLTCIYARANNVEHFKIAFVFLLYSSVYIWILDHQTYYLEIFSCIFLIVFLLFNGVLGFSKVLNLMNFKLSIFSAVA